MQKKRNIIFFKILSCFLVVVVIMSVALAAVALFAKGFAEKTALQKMELEFESGATEIERIFSDIKYALSELSVRMAADSRFEDGSYIESNNLRADMRDVLFDARRNDFSKYLVTAFVVDSKKRDHIYELSGTYASELFFGKILKSNIYSSDFWNMKIEGGSSYFTLKADDCKVLLGDEQFDVQLLPVAYKPQGASGYILVVMLDAARLVSETQVSAIASADGKFLFADEKSGEIIDGSDKRYHIFRYVGKINDDIEILRFIPKSELTVAIQRTGTNLCWIILALVFLALLASVVISRKMFSSISRVSDLLLSDPRVHAQYENGIYGVKGIENAVRIITSHEQKGMADGTARESMLDSLLLKSDMRNAYAEISDIKEQAKASGSSFMMYFKVNYLEAFGKYGGEDSAKATFLLKQLIEMYLENWGVDANTFHVQKNEIVSVIAAGNEQQRDIVDNILSKLSNESEYALFTVVVSKIYDDADKIKEVYDEIADLSRYGRPVKETQVLYEGEVRKGASRFYFSVEEMGKLSAVLQNGTVESVSRKVEEILEYNVKKDINRLEMYLLCTEIVNCSVKVANRMLNTASSSIDLTVVYTSLEKALDTEEYRRVCVDFLSEILDCISQNKREDDYIISYILDYVENHYAEDIYLNLFAEKLKLTGAYISSYFKEKMNVNLSDYVNNYRIKKAVELSENPQNKNKDIAVMVGLPNINTFIRLFKKYTGYTPGEYRKKHFGDDYKK